MPKLDAPTTPPTQPSPYWVSPGGEIRLFQGNTIDVLRQLPAQSVHCAITSPPYWGLRDYGTGTWEGGDEKCNHEPTKEWLFSQTNANSGKTTDPVSAAPCEAAAKRRWYKPDGSCRCGAKRTDYQIGSEDKPDCLGWARGENCAEKDWATACHVCRMALVFREVRRVLRDDGTLWLNYGDSYSSGSGGSATTSPKQISNGGTMIEPRPALKGMPAGNLVGVPWRVALALQADGWILRSDLPWLKRSAMPESVTNRPAKALEYVFLFAKKSGYYFDTEAVRKPNQKNSVARYQGKQRTHPPGWHTDAVPISGGDADDAMKMNEAGRNFRNADLWFSSVSEPWGMVGYGDELVGLDVTSQAYAGAHFATFPPKLVEPMILAGTSAKGCCAKCGVPWERIVERGELVGENRKGNYQGREEECDKAGVMRMAGTIGGYKPVMNYEKKTLGWQPSCACNADVAPCVLLDPFAGTMTVGCMGVIHGRHSIGIDLSEKYLRENAIPRCEQFLKQASANRKTMARYGGKVDLFTE